MMKEYLKALDDQIRQPSDITACGSVIRALAADSDCIGRYVAAHLERLKSEPHSFPDNIIPGGQLVFTPTPNLDRIYDLVLSRHASTGSSIVTPYIYAVICPMNADLVLEEYQGPSPWDLSVFDPSIRLRPLGTKTLLKGDTYAIRPDSRLTRLRVSTETLVLKIISKPILPYEWSFDEITLAPWQLISTVIEDTQLVHACRAAAQLGSPDFPPLLRALLGHDRHQVRWEALSALWVLNPDDGLAALRRFGDDSHPHIARTARQTLATLEA